MPSPQRQQHDGFTLKLKGSIDGSVDHLLLCVPTFEAQDFAATYGALIDALPPRTAITLLAQSGAEPHVRKWPCDPDRIADITFVDAGEAPMTSWACDLLLAGIDADGESRLLATPALDRREDGRLPALLAEQDQLHVALASEPFEGGNILIGQDHIFIGADSGTVTEFEHQGRKLIVIAAPDCPAQLRRTAHRGEEQWEEVFHYHNVAGTRQPVFHIDMFMTLAGPGDDGRERILVGDPAMAAEILGMPVHPLALAPQFDAIAGDLVVRGFDVIRNPLPMIYMDNVEHRRRTWFYASSNNVLVQRSAEAGNFLWMPEYGHDHWPELVKTDAANRKIWQELGYEVRMIPDGQRLAENLGGLHCLTNVLKRG